MYTIDRVTWSFNSDDIKDITYYDDNLYIYFKDRNEYFHIHDKKLGERFRIDFPEWFISIKSEYADDIPF